MSVVRGLVLIAVLPLLMLAASPAVADAQSKGDPTELWERFPLDPTVTPAPTEAPPPRASESAGREPVRVVPQEDGQGALLTVVLMVVAAGTGALGVMLVRGRARSGREETDER